MGNPFGRSVILPLTNKSGGSVAVGDVVIVDTSNNDSFTTTTSGGFTGTVGVAQQAIASNAVGLVLLSGYAALVNVNASVTRGHFGKTHTVVKQATGVSARAAGTFCQFLTGGTTPDAVVYASDLAAASLADPTTTRGDIIYRNPSNVLDRLGVGAAGRVLTSDGTDASWQPAAGGVSSGTSFPGSPADGDLYYRTDRDLLYRYRSTGTRWVTATLYHEPAVMQDSIQPWSSSPSAIGRNTIWAGDYDIYLEKLIATLFGSGNDSSNYWTLTMAKGSTANSFTDITSVNNQSASDSTWVKKTATIGAVLGSNDATMRFTLTKTGGPNAVYCAAAFTYRLVG
jgi:hypothetical protein